MKPLIPTLWRLTATMKANSAPGSLFDAKIHIPKVLEGGERSYDVLQLNYPFIIVDGFIESELKPDAQIVIVANDGERVIYSNPLNHTLIETGRPRIPLFSKPILVRPMTKLVFKLRNLEAVGGSDVNVVVHLKVRPL